MTSHAPALDPGLRKRLSLMMFLQYAIWGAWVPILYSFLMGHRGFSLDQTGQILAAGAIGAIAGPFVAGQFADRYFATEKFLAVSHLLGAGLVLLLARIETFSGFLWVSLFYGLIYAPTVSLTNSLAFHHLPDRDRDFGRVRVWGAIGWIAAGIGVGQWLLWKWTPIGSEEIVAAAQNEGRAFAFYLSGGLGLLLAVFCLFLPHTPPAKQASQANATMAALGAIRMQPLLTLFLLAIPISVVHQFYFVHTSEFLSILQRGGLGGSGFADIADRIFGVGGGGMMTIGQMSEVAVLALIPMFAKRCTRKTLLAVGLAAYAMRMWLFAHHDAVGLSGLIFGLALHGLCFGCFIFVAFMIVDEETSNDVRASAQNLFNLVIIGLGIIVGSWFATSVIGEWSGIQEGRIDGYDKLFSVPMYIAIACLAVLAVFYPRQSRSLESS